MEPEFDKDQIIQSLIAEIKNIKENKLKNYQDFQQIAEMYGIDSLVIFDVLPPSKILKEFDKIQQKKPPSTDKQKELKIKVLKEIYAKLSIAYDSIVRQTEKFIESSGEFKTDLHMNKYVTHFFATIGLVKAYSLVAQQREKIRQSMGFASINAFMANKDINIFDMENYSKHELINVRDEFIKNNPDTVDYIKGMICNVNVKNKQNKKYKELEDDYEELKRNYKKLEASNKKYKQLEDDYEEHLEESNKKYKQLEDNYKQLEASNKTYEQLEDNYKELNNKLKNIDIDAIVQDCFDKYYSTV